ESVFEMRDYVCMKSAVGDCKVEGVYIGMRDIVEVEGLVGVHLIEIKKFVRVKSFVN
ncbi:20189_t:CDS:1, partial [Cetraspora pellucida]